ncbi:MAG TPA: methyltransferase domain-containing protein, partial [Cyclobacteriaceae bacterium]|nr:methyltransferase domain-containing protein [Cyclobacteriaceae bacterium]
VEEGFSIAIFPEGTRSPDGTVKRFHKGAFFLAEKLNLDVTPLLIHGAWDTIRKGDFYVNDATLTLKFLPVIKSTDIQFGQDYSTRTKTISRYFKQALAKLAKEAEQPEYFRYKLLRNYYYKGPVLEWYAKIKLSLEDNYTVFNTLVPANATVLDLGCGYGFLSYMLSFTSAQRQITGIDYDEDKILTAQHCYSKTDRVNFICADITTIALNRYDVIILSDVLHYLQPPQQAEVLQKAFMAMNPGGKIILRDANAELGKRHRGSVLTEFFSTKVFRFNKAAQKLHFIKAETVVKAASNYNLTVEILDNTRFTSNVIFVIK